MSDGQMPEHTARRIRQVEAGVLLEPLVKGGPLTRRPLAERMAVLDVPGVSVAVINDGELEWARAYGVKEVGGSERVTPGTLFQACSISKPVTAVAVMRLAREGVLDLDEDVNAYLTSWKVPANGSWQPRVTLRQLLSHTAGTTVHGFPGYRSDRELPTVTQVLGGERPANTPAVRVNTVPGTQFRYSGGGTTIVQQLLIDVTGRFFPDLMSETVLEPLGMGESTYEQPLPEGRWADAATGHHENGAPVKGKWHQYPEIAAAGLWTTPSDLCRVALEVQQAMAGRDSKLLANEEAGQMLTRRAGGPLGIGFWMEGEGETLRFGHGGDNVGFKCQLVAYAKHGVGAAVMTNGDAGYALCEELLGAIANEYRWPLSGGEHQGNFYPAREAIRVDPQVLKVHAGEYELGPDLRLHVAVDGEALMLQPTGQSPIRLFPESETKYYAETVDVEVTFLKNRADETTGLNFHQNTTSMEAKKLA